MQAAVHQRAAKTVPAKPPVKSQARPARTNPVKMSAWEKMLPIQFSLNVNKPDDKYEQEANRVAERVMRMPESAVQRKTCACGKPAGPDGLCDYCRRKKQQALQRKSSGIGGQTTPPAVHQVLQQPGRPLESSTRSFMEARFGQNFGGVRVHTDEKAAESAESLNAAAYTVGQDIVFGAGRYAPGNIESHRLLAHELTHVVQQTGMAQNQPSPQFIQRQQSKDDNSDIKWLDDMIKSLEPDDDSRKMTPAELDFAMTAEKARTDILFSAIEKLNQFTGLLITNSSDLRPMSAEAVRTLQLVRSYLRIRPKGLFTSGSSLSLEFDYLNKGAGETEGSTESDHYFLYYIMEALKLMLGNVQLMLPKYVFKDCVPGLYAQTLGKMKLCPQFFGKGSDKNPTCPEWVLLHEYFHPLGVAHGEAYGANTMAVPGPKQAIRNANALASLAFELAGRDPKKCHAYGPRETHGIADCKYAYEATHDTDQYKECIKNVFSGK
ncbi:MAG: DUF4157 domain-containing protein [Candidatus Promineifilaceae bacterium]